MAMERLNDPLTAPRIAHRLARYHDARLQRCITHELLGPQVSNQLVLQDYTVPVCDEVDQELKDLGPQRDPHAGPAQLIALGVEGTVSKHVAHGPGSSIRCGR